MANPALIDELEKQFRDNPRRVFARLANEYRKAGDFMRAIEICHAHVPQQPGYISGHIVLGQALYDAGELDQAQQTFQAALSLDPENLIALRQMGDIARNRRDYREARSWYTRLLEVDPQNDEIVAQLGEIALAEGDGAGRDESASASTEAEEEQSGVATATAVADDEDERMPEPVALDDSDEETDALMHNDVGARLDAPELERVAEDHVPTPEFTNIGELPADSAQEFTIDAGEMERDAHTFSNAGQQPAEPDAGPSGEPDEDDVAWIAAESTNVESPDFTVSDATEADSTEFVVSETSHDYEQSPSPQSDDFGFAFETEELEEPPLRPHTGESLSIIAEEDALAGVQPTRVFDRSPFGDPIAPKEDSSESAEASFEPLPIQDIEAASAEAPAEELGGEDLLHEMTRWSSDTAESDASPAEPDATLDEAHADIFIGSEETVIEETTVSETIIDEPRDTETLIEEAFADADWIAPRTHEGTDAPPAAAQTSGAEDESSPVDDAADEIDLLFQAPDAQSDAEPEPADDFQFPTPVAGQPVDVESDFDSQFPVPASLQSSEPDGSADSREEPAAAAFVTETMAELYLRQGFRNEALDVYRRLAAQSPDDSALRARIAELEHGSSSTTAGSATAERTDAPVSAMQRPAAAFFKSLASVQPPPPPQPAEPDFSDHGRWDEMLSDAGDISEPDDTAAKALSNGYHAPTQTDQPRGAATRAADRKMSLHDIFGSTEQLERGAAAGSLDAFFTPEGEPANNPQGDEEGREDLEAFNAWLEGLKK